MCNKTTTKHHWFFGATKLRGNSESCVQSQPGRQWEVHPHRCPKSRASANRSVAVKSSWASSVLSGVFMNLAAGPRPGCKTHMFDHCIASSTPTAPNCVASSTPTDLFMLRGLDMFIVLVIIFAKPKNVTNFKLPAHTPGTQQAPWSPAVIFYRF